MLYTANEIIEGLAPINNDFNFHLSGGNIYGEGGLIGKTFDVNYARHIYNIYETAPDYAKIDFKVEETNFILDRLKHWKDQVVVDLGAGSSEHGLMLANVFGAKSYIGVEPHFYNQLKRNLEFVESDIPYAIEKGHMREFLGRLPDNSVSILASGIDNAIVWVDDYLKQTATEITRVLHPNGVFLSFGSNVFAEGIVPEVTTHDGGINMCKFYFKD